MEENKETKEVPEKANAKSKGNGLLVFLVLVAIVLGGVGTTFSLINFFKTDTPITFLGSGTDGNSANFVEGSIASVAEKVSASVVSIVTSTKQKTIFGNYESGAAGTGVIVSTDGYILTNKHVIDGANKINVILDDGTTYENVKLVTTDPLNDIAFLKIDGVDNLPVATLGDSKTINVGQQVIAIGNALGQYQNTVTAGIISGTGRAITASDGNGSASETLYGMIQTDAAINSGNSGGPLVNAAGEVIGINTATSTTAENMGFAIPISSVKGMLAQLIEGGSAKRAFLGVYTDENYTVQVGANSPAAKAGVKDGDTIAAINGVKVGRSGSASNIIGEYKPGDTVQLTVIRDGNEIAINVTLGGYDK
ncbi:trypsin-like peptidase domain-containing protein [Candidatus Saccharibacteria bacterium]|nr:trypsin-like peptidase domain-containing protein [Candidatus Saccharibacteria bacterium]